MIEPYYINYKSYPIDKLAEELSDALFYLITGFYNRNDDFNFYIQEKSKSHKIEILDRELKIKYLFDDDAVGLDDDTFLYRMINNISATRSKFRKVIQPRFFYFTHTNKDPIPEVDFYPITSEHKLTMMSYDFFFHQNCNFRGNSLKKSLEHLLRKVDSSDIKAIIKLIRMLSVDKTDKYRIAYFWRKLNNRIKIAINYHKHSDKKHIESVNFVTPLMVEVKEKEMFLNKISNNK